MQVCFYSFGSFYRLYIREVQPIENNEWSYEETYLKNDHAFSIEWSIKWLSLSDDFIILSQFV